MCHLLHQQPRTPPPRQAHTTYMIHHSANNDVYIREKLDCKTQWSVGMSAPFLIVLCLVWCGGAERGEAGGWMDEEGEGGHKLRRTVRRHDRPLHRPPKAVQVMGQGTRGIEKQGVLGIRMMFRSVRMVFQITLVMRLRRMVKMIVGVLRHFM